MDQYSNRGSVLTPEGEKERGNKLAGHGVTLGVAEIRCR
jgi:hypothetical protein